jgi:sulfur carrier protein
VVAVSDLPGTAFLIQSEAMNIKVNGKPENTSVENLAAYLRDRGLALETLVVEHNGQVIRADRWADTLLREGDRLELLSFVGGG